MFIKSLDEIVAFKAGDKTNIKEILHPSKDNLPIQYSLAHANLSVGTSSIKHYLKGSEVYIILSGTGEIVIDEARKIVQTGDIIWIPANAIQHIENIGTVPLNFLCIVDPAWKMEDEVIL